VTEEQAAAESKPRLPDGTHWQTAVGQQTMAEVEAARFWRMLRWIDQGDAAFVSPEDQNFGWTESRYCGRWF
jgi:hypothetical protein